MKTELILLPVFILVLLLPAFPGNAPSKDLMAIDMTEPGAYEEVLKCLDAGANPNAWVKGGDRPIFHAVRSGHPGIVNILLERGADPNVSLDDATNTPLNAAVEDRDPEIVRALVDGKADVNYKMRGAVTVLHNACLEKSSPSVTEIIRLLIDSGADVNAVTHFGDTPLMNAAQSGNTDAVKLLLEHGADAKMKNIRNKTALDIAVSSGAGPEIISLLKSWKKKGK